MDLGKGPAPQPGSLDTSGLFETSERQPVDPALVSTWRYDAEDRHSLKEVFRTPDGRTYVAADSHDADRDRRRAPASYAAAFDTAGQPLWVYRPEGGQRITSHLFSPGQTLVASRSEEAWGGSTLVALDERGTCKWRYQPEGTARIDSMRQGPDGTVYVKEGDRLTALAPDGQKRWTAGLSLNADDFFHVAGPDGTQYFASDNFSNNLGYDSFRAVTPDGRVQPVDWPEIGSFPLEVGSRLVYGGQKGEIHGLDLAGGPAWTVQTDSVRGLQTPWLGRDGNVYARGRFDAKLYALSPDGRQLWSRTVDDVARGGLDCPFQVDRDGSVYYQVARTDEIQRILPDGRPGERLRGGPGLEGFRPGGDGKLYTYGRTGVISVVDLESGHLFRLPLKIERPQLWDIEDVLPSGVVVLQDQGSQCCIQPSRDRELKEALERAVRGARPAQPGQEISEDDGWIQIGDVRLPVHH